MLPIKPPGALTRTAAAAKAKWISGGGQQNPGFFISTPQYQRQRAKHNLIDDGRRRSESVDSCFCLTFPNSANFSTGAALSSLDEDDKDVAPQTIPSRLHSRSKSMKADSPSVRDLRTQSARRGSSGIVVDSQLLHSEEMPLEETTVEVTAKTETDALKLVEIAVDDTHAPVDRVLSETLGQLITPATSADQTNTTPAAKIAELNRQEKYTESVLLFKKIEESGEVIGIDVYDELMLALAAAGLQSGDLTILLQTFEDILARDIVPRERTYQILLSSISDLAQRLQEQHEQLSGHLDQTATTAKDYAQLAVGIFLGVAEGDVSKLNTQSLSAVSAITDICSADLQLAHSCLSAEQSAALDFKDCPSVESLEERFSQLENPTSTIKAAFVYRLLKLGAHGKGISYLWNLEHSMEPNMSPLVLAAIRGFCSSEIDEAAYRWLIAASDVLETGDLFKAFCLVCTKSHRFTPSLFTQFESIYNKLLDTNELSPAQLVVLHNAFLSLSINLENFGAVVVSANRLQGKMTPANLLKTMEFMCLRDAAPNAFRILNEFTAVSASERYLESAAVKKEFFARVSRILESSLSSGDALTLCTRMLTDCWSNVPASFLSAPINIFSAARIDESPELASLISERTDRLRAIALSFSHHVIGARVMCNATVLRAFSLILSDCIMNGVPFTSAESKTVTSALDTLGLPTAIWTDNCIIDQNRVKSKVKAQINTSTAGKAEVGNVLDELEPADSLSSLLDSKSLLHLRTDVEFAKSMVLRLFAKRRFSDAFFLLKLSQDRSLMNLVDQHLAELVHVQGDRDTALEYARAAEDARVAVSPEFYFLLIEAWLLPEPNLAQADSVLKRMNREGISFSGKHFAKLIWARGVLHNDLPAAQEFYRGLVKNKRFRPDESIFSALIDSYVANECVEGTKQVLCEMRRYQVPVSEALFKSIREGWSIDSTVANRLDSFTQAQAV